MGTPLPTTDTAGTVADKTVVEIFELATTTAETAIIGAQPWLAWPVIKQFWEAIFSGITGAIGSALGIFAGYLVIDIEKYKNLLAAGQALVQLRAAQASGDQNAIDQANTNADAAAAPILHYVGTVSV